MLSGKADVLGQEPTEASYVRFNRVSGAFANFMALERDAAHPRSSRKWDEMRLDSLQIASTQSKAVLRQNRDTAPFRGFIGQRSQMSRLGQFAFDSVPPGDYELTAKGVVRGFRYENRTTVTVAPAKEPDPIKLVFGKPAK